MAGPIALLLLWLLACSGCADDPNQPAAPQNSAPTILSCTADPATVPSGSTSILSVDATDDDGASLTYAWTADGGQFPVGNDSETVTWSPPDQMGIYTVTVTVGDGTDTTEETMTINVTVPEVVIDPLALDFGIDTTSLQFSVTNGGDGVLNWSAAADTDWLTIDPDSGDIASGLGDDVTVTVDRTGLTPGSHDGTVVVTTTYGDSAVAVSVSVPTPPTLSLSTSTLDFGAETVELQFEITNSGDGELTWTTTASTGWLDVTPTAGATQEETDDVVVTVDRSGLAPGSYQGTVDVTSNGGEEAVNVEFIVLPDTPSMTNLFFLHHSTGRNLINEGSVRSHLASRNGALAFWDHDYNYGCGSHNGLRDPSGSYVGYDYDIPGAPCGNTDPDGLHYLWTTANSARATILANHEVIAFKSCYPASDIGSASELNQYKTWYLAIRDFLDTQQDKVFVIMSPPPRHRLATDLDDADRARAFADWLGSPEFLDGHPNLRYFNFFDLLAHPADGSSSRNMLRYEYERSHSSSDSHPNTQANQTVGPIFADALVAAAGGAR